MWEGLHFYNTQRTQQTTNTNTLPPNTQARTVAEAFLQAHQSRQGHRGLGGRPVLPLSSSAAIGGESRATAEAAERVYATLHDVLVKAVNYRCVWS